MHDEKNHPLTSIKSFLGILLIFKLNVLFYILLIYPWNKRNLDQILDKSLIAFTRNPDARGAITVFFRSMFILLILT